MANGWNLTMRRKVEYILRGIEENKGNVFCHSDSDIQFFNSFAKECESLMVGKDLLAQDDGPKHFCCGFMLIRANDKTKELFEGVLSNMDRKISRNDQEAMYSIIKGNKEWGLNVDYLDKRFMSLFHLVGPRAFRWNEWTALPEIKKNTILHHANWVIGTDKKKQLMKKIREKYYEQ